MPGWLDRPVAWLTQLANLSSRNCFYCLNPVGPTGQWWASTGLAGRLLHPFHPLVDRTVARLPDLLVERTVARLPDPLLDRRVSRLPDPLTKHPAQNMGSFGQ